MQVRMLLVGVVLAAAVAGPVGASGAQDGSHIWEGEENYGPAEFDLGGLIRFDSGYLLYGYVPEPDREGSNDLLLVRTDRSGETQWTRRINQSAREVLRTVVRTSDGFVVGGDRREAFTAETPTARPGYVMKLGDDGTVRWVTDLPGDGPGDTVAYRGGVVTTVRLDAFQTSVARVGADGEVLWNRSYSAGQMRAVTRSGDHLVVAGNSRFGPSVVGTVAPDGDLTEVVFEAEDANFHDVAVTSGGATYVVGQVSNETVEASVDLTVRLGPDGDEQWRRTVLPTPNGSSVRAVTLGPRGSVYVAAVGFGGENRLVHLRADGSVSREFERAVTPVAYAPSGHLLYVSPAGIEAIEHRPGTPTPSPTPTATPTPTPSPTATPTPTGTPAGSETRTRASTDGTGSGPGVATAVAALVALALAARS